MQHGARAAGAPRGAKPKRHSFGNKRERATEKQASEKRDDEVCATLGLYQRSRIRVTSRTRFDTTYDCPWSGKRRTEESGQGRQQRDLSVSAERCPYSVQTLIHSDSKSAQCVSLSSRSVRMSNAVITRWLWLGMGFRLSTRLRKDPQNQLGRPRHPHPLRRARWEQPRTLARSPGHRSGWAWRRAGREGAA